MFFRIPWNICFAVLLSAGALFATAFEQTPVIFHGLCLTLAAVFAFMTLRGETDR